MKAGKIDVETTDYDKYFSQQRIMIEKDLISRD